MPRYEKPRPLCWPAACRQVRRMLARLHAGLRSADLVAQLEARFV